MNIALIGSIPFDTIYPVTGKKVQGFGGVFYATVALAQFLTRKDIICPVAYMGRDLIQKLHSELSQLSNVSDNAIIPNQRKNYRVTNTYFSLTGRNEVASNVPPALQWRDLKTVVKPDYIYLNFITGRDITFPTFQRFLQRYPAPVYLDLHMHLYGIRKNGLRYLRRAKDWWQWISISTYLQLNQQECEVLSGNTFASEGQMAEYCADLFTFRQLQVVLLTFAEQGSLIMYRDGSAIGYIRQWPDRIQKEGDVTGCGDVFGSAFFARYVRTKNMNSAARFANKMAGVKAGMPGNC